MCSWLIDTRTQQARESCGICPGRRKWAQQQTAGSLNCCREIKCYTAESSVINRLINEGVFS